MVCLHFLVQLNSDLLYVNQLPVCTAGTANRLIDPSFEIYCTDMQFTIDSSCMMSQHAYLTHKIADFPGQTSYVQL